jgi:membrane-bound lytic murein transglycosylase A
MIAAVGLNGCAWLAPPGISGAVSWRTLPAWDQDRHAESWPALLRSCEKLARQDRSWEQVCAAAHGLSDPSDAQAREFFEEWFTPHKVRGAGWRNRGLITGYYEPLLQGRFTPSEQFRFPVYARPKDLLIVDLSELFPELKDKRVRGKLIGNKVVPYYNRQQIDTQQGLLEGQELLWVDDPVALFFLHIQGSGRMELADGRIVAVGYADQNGHPYRSIGRELIAMGELASEDVNMFSIRDWLRDHPHRAEALFHRNPSYVFFALRPAQQEGPVGSLNVPLTAQRSLAVDRNVIPLGVPVWLDTTRPGTNSEPYRRLVLAQDTGGAIKGAVRADLFWGRGVTAERMAGLMKQPGRIFVLLPKKLR